AGLVGNGGGILPYAEVNGGANTGDFASYNQGGSIGVGPYLGYVTSLATAVAGDIVKLTAAAATTFTANANQSIGALLIVNTSGNAVVQVNPTGTLTLTTGALMTLGSGTATVTLGTGATNAFVLNTEGFLFQNNSGSGNTNVNGPITGTGSLNIAGTNAVFLSTTVNTFT